MTQQLTKELLIQLRKDIDAALASVGVKHGMILKAGSCSYGENNFSYKLNGQVEGGLSKEAEYFQNGAYMVGLTAADLGLEFIFRSETYIITGMKARGGKITITNKAKGTLHTITAEALIRTLARPSAYAAAGNTSPEKKPAASAPVSKPPVIPTPALTDLYIEAAAASKMQITALKEKYGHLNAGMQGMQLKALIKRSAK